LDGPAAATVDAKSRLTLEKMAVPMMIYKFRSLEPSNRETVDRILQIVVHNRVWCAAPERLNDPEEFRNRYLCTGSRQEREYLAKLIAERRGWTTPVALRVLETSYRTSKSIKALADPVFSELTAEYRKDLGLSCFSMVNTSPILWERYGGDGNGVCISIEIPDTKVGKEYRIVDYVACKKLPMVFFLKAYFNRREVDRVIQRTLFTKTKTWCDESEIRFVAKRQDVSMVMDCAIRQVAFGNRVHAEVREELTGLIHRECTGIEVNEA
jgi:hypothetical protein